MRILRQIMLFVVASLPVLAWEAPTRNEQAAVMGQEPQLTVLESGLPLPPTQAEAREMGGYRYDVERAAMKHVLLYRTCQAKADRGRITPENNAASVRLARRLGAPELFARYLDMLGDNTMSRRQQYAVNQALRYLLQETYAIDTLQMRVVSESVELPAAQHMLFMLQLPYGSMFDLVPTQLPPKSRILSDIMLMTSVMRQEDAVLSSVCNTRSADAAAAALQALIPLWETTLQTRHHAQSLSALLTPAERMSVRLLESTAAHLLQTRQELHKKDWFGSVRLRIVDELLRDSSPAE